MVNAAERQSYVQKLLREKRHVTVSELSEELDVSEVTIRKDLNRLEEHNLLVRTHGGAILPDNLVYDRPFEEKADRNKTQKRQIGRKASTLVEDDDTMFIDAGTTTIQVARNLSQHSNITVITNAVNIAMDVVRDSSIEVFMMGGLLRSSSASVVGPYTEHMINQYSCSKLFLGVDGFDPDHGLTTTHPMEAKVNQLMIESANNTIVVTDSTKFGRRGLSRICSADDIDYVITDEDVPQKTVDYLNDKNINIEIVDYDDVD